MSVPRTGESSEQANTRLRAEGRRDAFDAKRAHYEQEQAYCKTDAYYMALADFPPLGNRRSSGAASADSAASDDVELVSDEVVESKGAEVDSDSVPKLNLDTPDIRRDAYWAYNHIGRQDVKASDAPSQGAWNMLKYFGQNAQTIRDFLEEIAKPMLKSEPKGESYSDDGRELIALCERKRAEFVAEAAREGDEGRCGHCGHLIG